MYTNYFFISVAFRSINSETATFATVLMDGSWATIRRSRCPEDEPTVHPEITTTIHAATTTAGAIILATTETLKTTLATTRITMVITAETTITLLKTGVRRQGRRFMNTTGRTQVMSLRVFRGNPLQPLQVVLCLLTEGIETYTDQRRIIRETDRRRARVDPGVDNMIRALTSQCPVWIQGGKERGSVHPCAEEGTAVRRVMDLQIIIPTQLSAPEPLYHLPSHQWTTDEAYPGIHTARTVLITTIVNRTGTPPLWATTIMTKLDS